LVKIDQEMRPWECSQTDRHTDRHTDANRFYNLSHAICYSYWADNNLTAWALTWDSFNRFIVITLQSTMTCTLCRTEIMKRRDKAVILGDNTKSTVTK